MPPFGVILLDSLFLDEELLDGATRVGVAIVRIFELLVTFFASNCLLIL